MGLISSQIHEAKVAGAGYILALASGLAAVIWTTIFLDRVLTFYLGPSWAAAIIAALTMLPVLFVLIWRKRKKDREAEKPAPQLLSAIDDQLSEITRTAENLVATAPLVALALAALAGILATRFPAALSLLVQIVSRHQARAQA